MEKIKRKDPYLQVLQKPAMAIKHQNNVKIMTKNMLKNCD